MVICRVPPLIVRYNFIARIVVASIDYLLFHCNKIGTTSNYQRAPLSPEDNVFATDDIDVGNGEENDDGVVMNAEDIEFGDNDLGNENGMINID